MKSIFSSVVTLQSSPLPDYCSTSPLHTIKNTNMGVSKRAKPTSKSRSKCLYSVAHCPGPSSPRSEDDMSSLSSGLQFATRRRRVCSVGFWVTWFSAEGEHWSVCGLVSLDLSRKAVCVGSLPQGLMHTRTKEIDRQENSAHDLLNNKDDLYTSLPPLHLSAIPSSHRVSLDMLAKADVCLWNRSCVCLNTDDSAGLHFTFFLGLCPNVSHTDRWMSCHKQG